MKTVSIVTILVIGAVLAGCADSEPSGGGPSSSPATSPPVEPCVPCDQGWTFVNESGNFEETFANVSFLHVAVAIPRSPEDVSFSLKVETQFASNHGPHSTMAIPLVAQQGEWPETAAILPTWILGEQGGGGQWGLRAGDHDVFVPAPQPSSVLPGDGSGSRHVHTHSGMPSYEHVNGTLGYSEPVFHYLLVAGGTREVESVTIEARWVNTIVEYVVSPLGSFGYQLEDFEAELMVAGPARVGTTMTLDVPIGDSLDDFLVFFFAPPAYLLVQEDATYGEASVTSPNGTEMVLNRSQIDRGVLFLHTEPGDWNFSISQQAAVPDEHYLVLFGASIEPVDIH